jgi:hypothetical protein
VIPFVGRVNKNLKVRWRSFFVLRPILIEAGILIRIGHKTKNPDEVGALRFLLQRRRDSNPRTCYGLRFSRPVQ